MSTPRILMAALAAATLGATGAMAGSWPPTVSKKVAAATDCCRAQPSREDTKAEGKAAPTATQVPAASNGFEYAGGESMYQLAQHKYEFKRGGVAHAVDCPMTVAMAKPVAGPRQGSAPDALPGA